MVMITEQFVHSTYISKILRPWLEVINNIIINNYSIIHENKHTKSLIHQQKIMREINFSTLSQHTQEQKQEQEQYLLARSGPMSSSIIVINVILATIRGNLFFPSRGQSSHILLLMRNMMLIRDMLLMRDMLLIGDILLLVLRVGLLVRDRLLVRIGLLLRDMLLLRIDLLLLRDILLLRYLLLVVDWRRLRGPTTRWKCPVCAMSVMIDIVGSSIRGNLFLPSLR